mmetsp:Transcript_8176/g.18904  ORF Transcript_8176/g.18904 Transcript_8176/m.18904 type:complete len:323 (-) Transcript_8176:15-983(-)
MQVERPMDYVDLVPGEPGARAYRVVLLRYGLVHPHQGLDLAPAEAFLLLVAQERVEHQANGPHDEQQDPLQNLDARGQLGRDGELVRSGEYGRRDDLAKHQHKGDGDEHRRPCRHEVVKEDRQRFVRHRIHDEEGHQQVVVVSGVQLRRHTTRTSITEEVLRDQWQQPLGAALVILQLLPGAVAGQLVGFHFQEEIEVKLIERDEAHSEAGCHSSGNYATSRGEGEGEPTRAPHWQLRSFMEGGWQHEAPPAAVHLILRVVCPLDELAVHTSPGTLGLRRRRCRGRCHHRPQGQKQRGSHKCVAAKRRHGGLGWRCEGALFF